MLLDSFGNYSTLEKIGFSNHTDFHIKTIYKKIGNSSENISGGSVSFNPTFNANNPLYQLIESQLCYGKKSIGSNSKANDETCYFEEDSFIETINTDFAKKFKSHDLRDINQFKPESNKLYFIALERRILRGTPLTLDEFNEYGVEGKNHKDQTVYEFFSLLKDGKSQVDRYNLYYDHFRVLAPIKFSVNYF